MPVPDDRKYLETHEWFRVDGDVVTVGISQFAADELTDITYVELPEVGSRVEAGTSFGDVESVKATSELNSAVSGEVVEVNTRLEDEPELLNSDPFGDGWIMKVRCLDRGTLENLFGGPAYDKLTAA